MVEYPWIIYYPYNTLLKVIQNTKGGLEKLKFDLDEIGFIKGPIHVKSLQWDWNHPPNYFLNIEDAY